MHSLASLVVSIVLLYYGQIHTFKLVRVLDAIGQFSVRTQFSIEINQSKLRKLKFLADRMASLKNMKNSFAVLMYLFRIHLNAI